MKNVLRLAIVDPSDASRNALKATLLGMDMIWLEAECSRYEFFADVVSQTQPDIGIVALDSSPDKAVNLISRIARESPTVSLLATSSSTDGNLILQTIRAGAKEFLTQPLRLEDLIAALDRIGTQRRGGSESHNRGCTVIAVAGSTGGVGSTSLAVNLGCALAQHESNSVALLDLDMSLGDADVLLDTIPDYTLLDVAQNVERLDFSLLKRSLTKHSSGLFLLPRPVQMEDAAHISPDDLQRVIGLLKATFTHLILDLSKCYNPIDRMAMQSADHVLVVTQLDLPCLRNVVRLMASFAEMDGILDKVKIVVNRYGLESGQISLKKAQDTIGREIFWKLPNDYRTMVEVRNNGVPLVEQAPKAKLTQAIVGLAEALCHGQQPVDAGAIEPSSKTSFGKLLSGIWTTKGS
ncbi:MAG: AAA family ATPase [Pirellulales bacterium]|nr:AAA family ATPase [Pirellulales bacterium]